MMYRNICLSLCFLLCLSCTEKQKYYYLTGELLSIVEIDGEGKNHGHLKKMYKTGELEGIGYYIHGRKNGDFKEFYKTGELKSIEKYRNDEWIDTTKFFFKSGELSILKYRNDDKVIQKRFNKKGTIISEGEIVDSLLTGWWNYYLDNGALSKRVEYSIIDKKQHLNQVYYYDDKGIVLKDSSNYFTLSFPDTILVKKLIVGEIKLQPLLAKQDNFYKVYFRYSDGREINNVPLDSTYSKNGIPAELWAKFDSPGKKKLKGYILEKKYLSKVNEKDSTKADIVSIKHKMYFEKEIYVKDTIE